MFKIFTILAVLLLSNTSFAEVNSDKKSIIEELNVQMSAGYVEYVQIASQYLKTRTNGYTVALAIAPFKSKWASPVRFSMSFTSTDSPGKSDMLITYGTGKPLPDRRKYIDSAKVYSFDTYYDLTKLLWSDLYPHLYIGVSYGKGYFKSNVPVTMRLRSGEIMAAAIDSTTNSRGATVLGAIIGTSYKIYKTPVSIYAEYKYNYSVPPSFATSKYVQGIPTRISDNFTKGKILKDYTHYGFVVGLNYKF